MDRLVERVLRALVLLASLAASAALWWPAGAAAARVKEIASVQGVRANQLVGYGLVVGLDGTGEQNAVTAQSLSALLQSLGVTLPPGVVPQGRNSAAVMVTAELPAFAQPGQTIDIAVSSMGNAKSLRGGTLVMTPLRGADGEIYAIAQGNLIVGGAGASAGGSKVQINHLSAGRVPGGASVERSVQTALYEGDSLQLDLRAADYSTAVAVANAINRVKGDGTAVPVDGRTVRVKMPPAGITRVNFMADIENLPVALERPAARVVLNPRTGSVVMNESVSIGACAVAHGSLSVTISSTPVVSQPNAFGQGQTVAGEKADIAITQQAGALVQMPAGTQLTDVVRALNALGATPQDLLAILQAMKAAGALNAELEVI
jgi:flagellar P-ring protein precursor FlgI